MTLRPLLVAIVLGVSMCLVNTPSVHAQFSDLGADSPEAAEADANAQRVFALAREAFETRQYAQAAAYFTEAYELSARPELLFNAGVSFQRGGMFGQARAAFERLLEDHEDLSNQTEVEARLVALDVETDGEPDVAPEQAPWQRPLAITGLALAGASLAAGAAFFVAGRSSQARVEDSSGEYWVDVEEDAKRARTFGVAGGVFVAMGAALLATGVVLFVVRPSAEESSDTATLALRAGLASIHLEGQW